jgi:hypothetical protein
LNGDGVSIQLDVSAVAIDGPTERVIHVLAYAYSRSAERPLGAPTTRAFRAYLQRAGYTLSRRDGKAAGGVLYVGGAKAMKTPVAAARECATLHAGLAACIGATPGSGRNRA